MDGRAIRVSKLLNPVTKRSVIVAFDHGGTGVPKGGADVRSILTAIGASPAEGVLIGCGNARAYAAEFARPDAPALVIAIDGPVFSSVCGDHGKLVEQSRHASPAYALKLGATAAKILLPVGTEHIAPFRRGVELVREAVMACEDVGLPLMVEPALWGPHADEKNNALIEHATRMAVELGADIVKIPAPTDPEVLARICANAPVPVMVLGGAPRDAASFAADMQDWMQTGVAGIVVGRNVWSRPNPAKAVEALAAAVHHNDPERVEACWQDAGDPAA